MYLLVVPAVMSKLFCKTWIRADKLIYWKYRDIIYIDKLNRIFHSPDKNMNYKCLHIPKCTENIYFYMHLISVQYNKQVLSGLNIQHNSYLCFFATTNQWNSCQHYYMGFADGQYVLMYHYRHLKNVVMKL